ncbi:hypothetical protein G6F56_012464 [Rhizopus delemar]|nr:hypothetical protein G6F56_012464 [Rhizopus delemar]
MGPFIVIGKNDLTNIYKLSTIGGEPCSSWVHIDRLKEVNVSEIQEPWYNPTLSRAAWRSEMGLDSHNGPTIRHDQSRSLVSLGDDVVSEISAKLNQKRSFNSKPGSQQHIIATKKTKFKPKPAKRTSRPPVVQASS